MVVTLETLQGGFFPTNEFLAVEAPQDCFGVAGKLTFKPVGHNVVVHLFLHPQPYLNAVVGKDHGANGRNDH